MIINGKRPRAKLYIVYQEDNGGWRGFCAPYDVTCQAESAEDAMHRIEDLVELYEDNLEKYNFPAHLTFKELSDKQDEKILQRVWKKIVEVQYSKSFLDSQLNRQEEEYIISGGIRSHLHQRPLV